MFKPIKKESAFQTVINIREVETQFHYVPQFSVLKLLTNRINSTYRKIKTGMDKVSLSDINDTNQILTSPQTNSLRQKPQLPF